MSAQKLNPAVGNARLALDILASFHMPVNPALLCSHLVERNAFKAGGANPFIKRTRTLLLQLLDADLVIRTGKAGQYHYEVNPDRYQDILDGVHRTVIEAPKSPNPPKPITQQFWYSGLGEIA